MKKIIFFCDRPIHVLTSIIIAFHIFEEEHTKSDICIFSSFSDSQRIAELLKKIGIFNQVLYLEKNRTSCRLMTKILSIFQYNETSRAQYFRNWILKQYISKTNLQGIDWQQYTVIFTASWGTPLWRELVFMLGKKKYQVNFYDDGVNSYINTDYIELRPKTLGQRIKKLFKHGKYGIHVVKNFLYNPTMIMYSSDKIQKIHFDLQNKELYKIIQNVYEFKKKEFKFKLRGGIFP